MLIGNLTRDPELRYTPSGTPVCSFGLATNRSWVASGAEDRQEETEFHNIVAWSKLAELCAQLLAKGRKVYIEGRLQTRSWETPNGEKRVKTEIVSEDMIVLDSRYKQAETKEVQENTVKEKISVEEVKKETPSKTETKEVESNEGNTELPENNKEIINEEKNVDKTQEDIDLDKIPF